MNRDTMRVVHSTLTLALCALAACGDESVGPKNLSISTPNPSSAVNVILVTNKSGGNDVGSLRWAARQPNGGTIQFDPSLAGDTIPLDSTLTFPDFKTIEGPADKGITISGRQIWRVIHARYGVTLRNVTITGGAADRGSAVFADELGAVLTLEHTTVSGNQGSSAAIYGPSVRLFNSTVSGNTGYWDAAGIEYYGLELTNSTVAGNGPAPGIGGYPVPYPSVPSAILFNSIIASNGVPLRNCKDSVGVWLGGPTISNDSSCGTGANMIVASPQLYSLANNGGPNMTHALAYDSPAINAGVYCAPPVDQRYVPYVGKCDIGAFEFTDFTKVTVTIDPNAKVDRTTGRAALTGTIKCTRYDSFRLALELHQDQKVNGQVVDVHAASDIPISCWTTAQPWSATMTLTDGAWQSGAARATAQTFATPLWVTPASAAGAVKISVARR
jgi:hypothetical protein